MTTATDTATTEPTPAPGPAVSAPIPRAAARHILQAVAAMTMLGASTAVSAHLTRYPVLGGQAVRYLVATGLLFAILSRRERRGRAVSEPVPMSGPVSGPGPALRPAVEPPGSGPESASGEAGARRPRLTLREWLLVVGVSLSGLVLFNVFVIAALRQTDAATLGSVLACTPLLLAVAGPVFTRTKRSMRLRTALCASAVVATGSAMVQGFGHGTATGLLFALAVLVCEALFSLLAVPLLPKLGELRLSAYVTAVAVPVLLVAGLIADGRGFLRPPTLAEAGALAYLSLVMTVIAFLLWYRALGGLGPQRAGLLIGVVPVSAAAASAALGVGVPGPAQLAGVVIVACGIVGGLAFA